MHGLMGKNSLLIKIERPFKKFTMKMNWVSRYFNLHRNAED